MTALPEAELKKELRRLPYAFKTIQENCRIPSGG